MQFLTDNVGSSHNQHGESDHFNLSVSSSFILLFFFITRLTINGLFFTKFHNLECSPAKAPKNSDAVDKFCVSLGVPIGAIGSTTCTYSCPINSAAESFNCNHGTGKWVPENSTLTCKGIDENLFETI